MMEQDVIFLYIGVVPTEIDGLLLKLSEFGRSFRRFLNSGNYWRFSGSLFGAGAS